MTIRRLLTCALIFVAVSVLASRLVAQGTTPAETAATQAALADHTAYTLAPALLTKAEALHRTRLVLHFGGALWSIVVLWLLLQLGLASRMRNVAVNLTKKRWRQCAIFVLELLVVLSLAQLPLEVYGHSVGLAYGLSVQGWLSWLGDQLLSFGLTYALGVLLVYLLFWRIRRAPRWWWLQMAGVVMVFSVIGVFLTPYVIDPLFNHFEPLEKTSPALVAQLEKVVGKSGQTIPPDRMFLMRASDKVTTINAYVTGFGASKRVVVWDTSIKKVSPDDIVFIFGHELGHYVHGDVFTGLLVGWVFILVSFFAGFHVFQWLLRRNGKRWRIPGQDHWGALVLFALVLSGLSLIEEPLENAYSRRVEHNADVFGQEIVHGLIADPQKTAQQSFDVLGANSFDDPNTSPLDFWVDSHPATEFRAAFARHYDPWAGGVAPKYLPATGK